MNRRSFIKFSALTGTSATLASCGNPEYHLIRFVPEDRLIPGVAEWKPSICPLCSAGCGLTVRVMEGDAEVIRNGQLGVTKVGLAKKLEGDPQHAVNQGKLCTRGQAAAEMTYHPDRIGHPLKRSGNRGDGKFEEISWDQALMEVSAKLDALAAANNQKSLAILTRPHRGMRNALFAEFAGRFGAPAPIAFEFFGDDVVRHANGLSFGKPQLPTLDLEESKYLISFGADFLGTWNSPVAQNIGYGHMRQGRAGMRGKFVQVEYRMSQTGANADEWVPVKPGMEGVLALGIAHVIMTSGARKPGDAGKAGSLIDGWMAGLPEYTPENVEKKTSVSTARIKRLAKEFVEQRPGVAIIAGAAVAQTNGLFNALAVNALNALVGAVETPGGIYFTPQQDLGGRGEQRGQTPLATTTTVQGSSPVSTEGLTPLLPTATQILLIDGANPVFASPKAWKVKEAIAQVPFVVSFGNFIDETSALADLILPDHSFLESWVQSSPESGTKKAGSVVAGPVMKPLHETRSTPDVVLEISRKLAKPLGMPWDTFEHMVKGGADSLTRAPGGALPSIEASPYQARASRPGGRGLAAADPKFDGDPNQYGFHLLPYPSIAFLDGSLAHLPLLQELPDPMSGAVWSSWVEINLQAAEKMGIRQGDIVEITSSQGSIRVPAFPSPGIAPDVLAIPVGQGHENYTRYATGRGANPIEILAPMQEAETGALAWAATRVKIAKVANADGTLVTIAGSLRDYPPERMHR